MTAVPASSLRPARRLSATPGQIALALAIAAFLLLFLVLPVATVLYVAFTEKGTSTFTLVNFYDFVRTELFMRSLWNSFYVAAMSVLWASVLALPLAYLTTRFVFRGAALVQTLGFLPLIMPPFVGAVAMQLFFGRNGSINLLLDDWLGFKIGFMEGLNGVIFVQSIHYFPFILINLSAALRNIDRAMEEAAQNLGSSGFRLFRRIVFPLALPGYLAGASLVFVKVFDDLATPLLLNVKDMLAPQAYLRVTSIGIADPMGYVISVVLIVASVTAMWLSAAALKGRDYATTQRGGGGLARRTMTRWEAIFGYGIVFLILALVLAPHLGLLLLSFATIWSFSPLPDGFTTAHYARVFGESSLYIKNTLIYASIAGGIDIVLGVAIAYLVLRTKLVGREWLDWAASAALAIPGVVLGIGYLRTFYGVTLPDGTPLASLWITIVLALAIRRLPYALRACYAALQQISVSLEEAAENPRRHQGPHGAARGSALDGGRYPGRLCHQLLDRCRGALGDLDARPVEFGRAPRLRALRLHAIGGRAGAGSGVGRGRGRSRRALHAALAPHHRTQPEGQRDGPIDHEREPAPHRPDRLRRYRGRQPVLWREPCPQGREPGHPPGRVFRLPRPVRLRQDHAAAPDRRLQPGRYGPPPDRRQGHLGAAALEARCRHGVPVLCALAAHDRPPQRRLRAGGAPAACARRSSAASRSRSISSGSDIWPSGGRPSSPAASSNASPSPARSRSSRRSCCSTSLCPISTPRCACKSGASCATCSSASA